MKTFEELRLMVEDAIKNLNLPLEPKNFYDPVRYILSLGGKRMRPVFTLMACNLFSDDVSKAVRPAIGMEVFHNFTLLHDDIMDHSNLRRKKPTVNAKWNDNVAILSGDGMCYIASQLVMESPAELRTEIMNLYHKTAIEVCEGQQYDMDFENQDDTKEQDYLEMIRLKTAVLPAACLKIGALIGGATEQQAQTIYDAGILVGLAFQLQDDYLDNYSTPEILGKPVGGDVNECKKTIFYIKTLDFIEENKKQEWINFYKTKDLSFQDKHNKAKEYFAKYKVDEYCQNLVNDYYQKAYDKLDSLNLKNLDVLKNFVEKLRVRIS
ncbi:MAG: polyprenyl synthetase family protein [Bacteroidales bacterium]|nr:polyprenyl synthetase family protein [Bacteroidales bacterium]